MKKIINFRPVFLFSLIFAAGIVSAWLFCLKKILLASLITAVAVVALTAVILIFKKRAAGRIVFAAAAFILGLSAMFIQASVLNNKRMYLEEVILTGTISDDYRVQQGYTNYYKMLLRDCSAETSGKTVKLNGTVYVDMECAKLLEPGDVITFKCNLNDKQFFKTNAETKYYRTNTYWETSCVADEIKCVKGSLKADEAARFYIKNTFSLLLDDTNAGTANALVLGDKSEMNPAANKGFRLAGVAHIFAVSGLHVGFLILIFNFLLRKLKINKYAALIITFSAVFAYAWLCGFSPSILRASLMTGVMMLAKTAGRQPDILSSLGFSATLILFIKPLYVADIGFLMSVASVFGICCITAAIKRFTVKIKSGLLRRIVDGFAVCFGASLGTFPLLVQYYGNFSLIGLFFNVIAIPLVTVIFSGMFLMLIPLLFSLAIPLNAVLTLFTEVAVTAGNLPFAVINMSAMGIGMIFYYPLLFAAGGFVLVERKKLKYLLSVLIVLIAATALLGGVKPASGDKIEFLDGGTKGSFAVMNKSGEHLIFSNLEKGEDIFRIAGYCGKYRLDKINVYITDFEAFSGFYAGWLQGYGINIETAYILGGFYMFDSSYEELFRLAENVVKLDFGIHSHGTVFETTGAAGTLFSVKLELGGKTVIYFVNIANCGDVMRKYRDADIVITDTDITEVWNFYKNSEKVTFGYFKNKEIYFPVVSGNFTLNVKNGRIVAVY